MGVSKYSNGAPGSHGRFARYAWLIGISLESLEPSLVSEEAIIVLKSDETS